jgi:AmmeMemoRadiSam system protein A
MGHPLIDVAREAIRAHLEGSAPAHSPDRDNTLPWGVFVSLHGPRAGREEGLLRGCIASLNPVAGSLEEEVGRVAISSAISDPRFAPLRSEEVDDLQITVYLLDAPEEVDGPEELDPRRYGIIVTGRGGRRGLLLPDLPGIDRAEYQLEAATRKAGLTPGSEISIQRFSAEIIS